MQRARAVTTRAKEPQVAGLTAQAAGTMQAGDSDCGPEGQRSAPSGSRRAATGVRNNRKVCSETVEDHDRRFWHRWPLTWRSSHAFTVLNTTRFHVRRLGTDLARRKSCGPGLSSEVASTPRLERSAAGGPACPAGRSWARLDFDKDGEHSVLEQERRSRRVRSKDVGQEHAKRGATPRSLLHPGATAVHPGKADY